MNAGRNRVRKRHEIRPLIGLLAILVCGAGTFATASEADQGRWRLEIYDGLAFMGLRDLNRLSETDRDLQRFLYDDQLAALVVRGEIQSWNSRQEHDYPKLGWSLPFGARLRCRLWNGLSVSLGFRYISRNSRSDPSFAYTRILGEDFSQTEETTFGEYRLAVKGRIPQVGIHLDLIRKGVFGLEGYLAGGPLFAECRFAKAWTYNWSESYSGGTYTVFESRGLLEEEGSGTGLALEAGLHLDFRLEGGLGFFCEAGWAYQKAGPISGSGREIRLDRAEDWDGEWEMRRELLVTSWGEYQAEFPSNLHPPPNSAESGGDFRLDLSGVQLRLGLAIRF